MRLLEYLRIIRVKVLELIICCKMRINKPQNIPKSVLVLIDYLKHKKAEDKIPPGELYDTIQESDYLPIMQKKQLIDLLNSEIF